MAQTKKRELKQKDNRGHTPGPKVQAETKKQSGRKVKEPDVNPLKPDVLKARVPTGPAAQEYISPSAPLDEEPT